MTDKITKTLAFLNQTFDVSEYWKTRPSARAYRYDHSIRVAKIGEKIAEAEGFDKEAIIIACLLHDCAYGLDFDIKNSWLYKEPVPELEGITPHERIMYHGYTSALHSCPFIESLGYKGSDLDNIVYSIYYYTYFPAGANRIPLADNLFTKTVRDADEVDHVSAFRFYEDLREFNFPDSTQQERQEFIWRTKGATDWHMEHMYLDLRTETAKKLYKDNIDFRLNFLAQLQQLVTDSNADTL